MERLILINLVDGGVAVTHILNPDADAATVVQGAVEGTGSAAAGWREITRDDVPEDRTFRDAWRDDGANVAVDMPRAREIHMARIRAARNAALEAMDVGTLRAVGAGDTAARDAVETEKQVLRDIPETIGPDVEAAATPEELKAVWPEGLSAV